MIINVDALWLFAPNEVPEEARAPIEFLRKQASAGLGAPTDEELCQVERAAFGPEIARSLRRCGTDVRVAVYAKLLRGWGLAGLPPRSPLLRGAD